MRGHARDVVLISLMLRLQVLCQANVQLQHCSRHLAPAQLPQLLHIDPAAGAAVVRHVQVPCAAAKHQQLKRLASNAAPQNRAEVTVPCGVSRVKLMRFSDSRSKHLCHLFPSLGNWLLTTNSNTQKHALQGDWPRQHKLPVSHAPGISFLK